MKNPDYLYHFSSSPAGKQLLARLYGKNEAQKEEARWKCLAERCLAKRDEEAVIISSPGRTELAGNHTDHNNGKVLCAAIHLDALACVMPQKNGLVELWSDARERPFCLDLNDLEPKQEEQGKPEALIRGTASALAKRGWVIGGFYGHMTSSIPVGAGLSSSAAVEVLFAQTQSSLYNNRQIPALDLALAGQEAENIFFGKPCGLMDQMASALGGVASIDFGDSQNPSCEKLDYDFSKSGYSLYIINTGSSHSDLTQDYAAIPEEMKSVARIFGLSNLRKIDIISLLSKVSEITCKCGDRAFLRAIHFIKENARVQDMENSIMSGKFKNYLKLAEESGLSSWRLLQNVIPGGAVKQQPLAVALEASKEFLADDGVVRVHGGGFAGSIQAWVKNSRAKDFEAFMCSSFLNGLCGQAHGTVHLLHIRPDGVREA